MAPSLLMSFGVTVLVSRCQPHQPCARGAGALAWLWAVPLTLTKRRLFQAVSVPLQSHKAQGFVPEPLADPEHCRSSCCPTPPRLLSPGGSRTAGALPAGPPRWQAETAPILGSDPHRALWVGRDREKVSEPSCPGLHLQLHVLCQPRLILPRDSSSSTGCSRADKGLPGDSSSVLCVDSYKTRGL